MQHNEGTFQGYGGIRLYTQSWLPDTAPRALVAILHGYAEHSDRYMNMVNALVPHGYGLFAFDLRGHGRSEGRRGHVDHWSDYEADVSLFLDHIRAHMPDWPTFLLGHSNGGLIALSYGLRAPHDHASGLRGVIASAPSLAPPNISPILLTTGAVLSRVWPTFSMASGLNAAYLSRIPEVANAYRADPLVHDIGSARLSTEMTHAREWVLAHTDQWHLPLLLILGAADQVIPPQMTRQFYQRMNYTDKEIHIYPDSYHEVHNDLSAAQEMADLEHWMDRHL